jgi:hypothetical protein
MITSAGEQLCLPVIEPEPEAQVEASDVPDIVDALLVHHRGDYRAVLKDLLLDADFLRDQLYTASCLMSKGMGRGWKPKYERA